MSFFDDRIRKMVSALEIDGTPCKKYETPSSNIKKHFRKMNLSNFVSSDTVIFLRSIQHLHGFPFIRPDFVVFEQRLQFRG